LRRNVFFSFYGSQFLGWHGFYFIIFCLRASWGVLPLSPLGGRQSW
jgi:hypothetical protein